MEITHDNSYVELDKKIKDAKVDEQIRELKRIIPEQGFFKRRVEGDLSSWISIKDRRWKSMASMCLGGFINDGVVVVSLNIVDKSITITDSSLFDIIKNFGEKYGYKTIHTKYQM